MKTVRNGQKVWPYCSDCGCRLEVNWVFENTEQEHALVVHFYDGIINKDARGHSCSLVDKMYLANRKMLAHIGV
jgi:hypothetical protein